MTRTSLIIAALLLALALPAGAQKYAVVNTDYVLKSIPDYTSAQKRLDRYVADWTKELADMEAELKSLKEEYEQENYLLPESLKKRRQDDIRTKEQELRDKQQERFGPGGDLDKRRAELLKPVQDRVNNTIERIAHEKNFAIVFDKSASATILFASKKYDISDDVLELLGFKPNANGNPADDAAAGGNGKEGAKQQKQRPTNPEMRSTDNSKRGRDIQSPLGGQKSLRR